ncbi:hypothetical protein BLOT_014969 [Blomia tropicalis]|nr:hypothetical protein BLOT_014969 [Blomia tropicalis]
MEHVDDVDDECSEGDDDAMHLCFNVIMIHIVCYMFRFDCAIPNLDNVKRYQCRLVSIVAVDDAVRLLNDNFF